MARRAGERISAAMLLTIALGLLAVVVCLEAIGPPPTWRIDALWVHGHSRTVRMMIAALMIAGAATVMLFLFRGRRYQNRRMMIVLMWIAVAVLCAMVYWDRVPILYDVVTRHAR